MYLYLNDCKTPFINLFYIFWYNCIYKEKIRFSNCLKKVCQEWKFNNFIFVVLTCIHILTVQPFWKSLT